ncbi:MAG: DUF423 domain-containing protein [Cytophagales bacterium]|nr:DUF423 domain-containing protein [Cytophagales bacterium]
MQKIFLLIASLMGALSVAIGAFGAHALKAKLEAIGRLDTFETAVKYQFYHTFALIAVALLLDKIPVKSLEFAGWSFIGGTLVFSGSLYILCLTGVTKWGAVTPLGGLLFIVGWGLLGWSISKNLI